MAEVRIDLPLAFRELFIPAPFKSYYGGRGAAKSWSVATALAARAYTDHHLILCTREYQNSVKDSVHRLLCNRISDMGLAQWFTVTDKSIKSRTTESEFIYKGLHHNSQEIKSTEGITICWLEEAQNTTKDSILMLEPTIRKEGSEIIATWNPEEENAPIVEWCLKKPPSGAIVRKVSWRDNPHFSAKSDEQRRKMLADDPGNYDWIWEGGFRKLSEAVIFGKRVSIEEFEPPEGARFYFGADWGFANDPTVLIRFFIDKDCLFIDYEAYGYQTEIDRIAALFDTIPGARAWPIKADAARPETISYIRRQGFQISEAKKWKGSVEDGIEHIKGFKRIVIHKRCVKMQEEARLYSYKTDRRQVDENGQPVILPEAEDAWNHGFDSIRYGLDGYIPSRGGLALWEKLGSD